MPVQSQEDDGNDEHLENEELDLPTSPSTYDSNTQTQKAFDIDDVPMLIDNPPCLELVTTLCEDKNDIMLMILNLILILVTILKEGSMLMNSKINLMILFKGLNHLS